MPTNAKPEILVDTSTAVALVVADHEHHDNTMAVLDGRVLGLAGHAAFETFSVLTRLPSPLRRTPAVAHHILETNFPASRFLSETMTSRLLAELPQRGIAGGAVYDALVGAAAVEHGVSLATRDRRALATYRALDVQVEVLG